MAASNSLSHLRRTASHTEEEGDVHILAALRQHVIDFYVQLMVVGVDVHSMAATKAQSEGSCFVLFTVEARSVVSQAAQRLLNLPLSSV
jgi:hypothetical protein